MQVCPLQFCLSLYNDHLLFFLCLLIAWKRSSIFHQRVTCSGLCWAQQQHPPEHSSSEKCWTVMLVDQPVLRDRVRMLGFWQGRCLFQNMVLFLMPACKGKRCMSRWSSRKKVQKHSMLPHRKALIGDKEAEQVNAGFRKSAHIHPVGGNQPSNGQSLLCRRQTGLCSSIY